MLNEPTLFAGDEVEGTPSPPSPDPELPGVAAAKPEPRTFAEADVRKFWSYVKGSAEGVVEVRAIKSGNLEAGYFDNADDFVAACRALNGRKQVYAGINLRPVALFDAAPNRVIALRNTANDASIQTIQTFVIDADPIRPKDTAATKAQVDEALDLAKRIRAWAEECGWSPPPIVMSGNGAHVYFAFPPIHLENPEQREQVAAQLKNFEHEIRVKFPAEGIKIDSIANFSRIIKVPGTLSIKGENTPETPHRRARFMTEGTRVEDPALRDHILSLSAIPPRVAAPNLVLHQGSGTGLQLGDKPSDAVMRALFANRNLMARWQGRGKPGVGPDGQPLDTSRSAYDFSVATGLARAGITDLAELATAILHRPGGKAADANQGQAYAIRTAQNALAVSQTPETEELSRSNFEVQGASMTSANPRIFRLFTTLGMLKITAPQLRNQEKFDVAFADAFGVFPALGAEYGEMNWTDVVNSWLEGAVVEELPPEASEDFQIRLLVYKAASDLHEGNSVEDLDAQSCLVRKGQRYFKAESVDREVNQGRKQSKQISRGDICDHLARLGCVQKPVSIDGKKVRVYRAPDEWPDDVSGRSPQTVVALPVRPRSPVQLELPGLHDDLQLTLWNADTQNTHA